jgi:predicted MPP superfamily phosphohydrolase
MLERLITLHTENAPTSPYRPDPNTRQFRTLFISDVHLGARGCQADLLLDFLRHHDADAIYLVGDIVDGWQLRSSWYWPQAHNDVVQKLLRKARAGLHLLVAFTIGETQGQERSQFHRRVRNGACR